MNLNRQSELQSMMFEQSVRYMDDDGYRTLLNDGFTEKRIRYVL